MTRRWMLTALFVCEFVVALGIARCVAELRPDVVRIVRVAHHVVAHRFAGHSVHAVRAVHAALAGNARTYRESAPAPSF